MKNLLGLFSGRRGHRPDVVALSAYLDRRLTANEAASVESHAESCAACREQLAGLRQVRASLRATVPAEAPRSFRLRQADVEARRPSAAPWSNPFVRALPAMSAAAAAVFVVAVVMDVRPASDERSALTTSGASESIGMKASQPAGGLGLDDGTATAAGAEAYSPSLPAPSPGDTLDRGFIDATPPDGSGGAAGDAAPGADASTAAPEAVSAANDVTVGDDEGDAWPWRIFAIGAGLIAVVAAGGYATVGARGRNV